MSFIMSFIILILLFIIVLDGIKIYKSPNLSLKEELKEALESKDRLDQYVENRIYVLINKKNKSKYENNELNDLMKIKFGTEKQQDDDVIARKNLNK